MKRNCTSDAGFLTPRTFAALIVWAIACCIAVGTLPAFLSTEAPAKQRTLTFTDRVAYQRAIEDVYWRHRIWPKENPNPKPSLDGVMTQARLEKKVTDYLRKSQALEDYWQRSITAEDLQAEMDRMARNTKQPEVLRELFEALGNDPFLIAECLARPVLSERLVTNFGQEQPKVRVALLEVGANSQTRKLILANTIYTLPTISDGTTRCAPGTWTNTSTSSAPSGRAFHTAVWTGSEMIVWGGYFYDGVAHDLETGGRYNPSTDSWTATSTNKSPDARHGHTAVWTGREMIVWGGMGSGLAFFNTGGGYNPVTDTWTATSTTNAPDARAAHTAVWTGSEMIIWGGEGSDFFGVKTGGRYNPRSDSWTATSTVNAPAPRDSHTAVWTGSEMIVWGGLGGVVNGVLRTGGRYNPATDSWTATSIHNAPQRRCFHTAVWTGSQMIVWGGTPDAFDETLHTGGIYDPGSDSWTATNTHHAPDPRYAHTAVWTGSEMIVWGGSSLFYPHGYRRFNTGGRYNSSTDRWIATSTTNAPEARYGHTAVWTESEMIVWGGEDIISGVVVDLNTGGRYCADRPIQGQNAER